MFVLNANIVTHVILRPKEGQVGKLIKYHYGYNNQERARKHSIQGL